MHGQDSNSDPPKIGRDLNQWALAHLYNEFKINLSIFTEIWKIKIEENSWSKYLFINYKILFYSFILGTQSYNIKLSYNFSFIFYQY